MAQHYPVIVIGAGQAGLSMSYCLKQRGIEHVVLEANQVGHSWRAERWDTFCLVTPNWQCRLPGHAYAGSDPHGFMLRDDIVRYLEDYARSFAPPLETGVRVTSLTQRAGRAGRFELETSAGTFTAAQVVVAIGGYHLKSIPAMASALPASVLELHSADYRNPEALPPGEILVVGSGQSGCQIAEDLHLKGRKVHLAVGNAPRCARRYRGKDVVEWLDDMRYYDIPIDRHPNREQVRDRANHYVTGRDGGHDLDLRQFAREGMKLYGPLRAIESGTCTFAPELRRNLDAADDVYRSINRTIDQFIAERGVSAPVEKPYEAVWEPPAEVTTLDAEGAGISAVVWCIGFGADFRWIKLPSFDERGYPRHDRGVTPVKGLYFIGLPWLHTWGSGRFSGVGRDAEYLAATVEAELGSLGGELSERAATVVAASS
ncbi:MAG TPA: MSMEG_0569 family flavin-dependent oxidoreductase [Polyangiaceae bacterium]|jgi:putative flavoprotein involved in K+ transport|nr:MSMEG_0569 family flavin-dependent oxidoreductase [Polyangiaceae bacterium]